MKASEIRALTQEQRAQELEKLYKQESSVKLNIGQDNFTKTHKLSMIKRIIARFLTIESELSANGVTK